MIFETSSMDSTGISLETTFGPRNNNHHLLKASHICFSETDCTCKFVFLIVVYLDVIIWDQYALFKLP